ncbi:MAG: hypothetical protein D6780_01010, partial [Candidatus Dadabacteria bacterium]
MTTAVQIAVNNSNAGAESAENKLAEFRGRLEEVAEAKKRHQQAMQEALERGDAKALSLANEKFSKALDRFREAEKKAYITLADGRKLFVGDYAALEKIAKNNELNVKGVLGRIREIKNGRVTKLNLSGMCIKDVTGINRLKKLEELYLSGNQLTGIPDNAFA